MNNTNTTTASSSSSVVLLSSKNRRSSSSSTDQNVDAEQPIVLEESLSLAGWTLLGPQRLDKHGHIAMKVRQVLRSNTSASPERRKLLCRLAGILDAACRLAAGDNTDPGFDSDGDDDGVDGDDARFVYFSVPLEDTDAIQEMIADVTRKLRPGTKLRFSILPSYSRVYKPPTATATAPDSEATKAADFDDNSNTHSEADVDVDVDGNNAVDVKLAEENPKRDVFMDSIIANVLGDKWADGEELYGTADANTQNKNEKINENASEVPDNSGNATETVNADEPTSEAEQKQLVGDQLFKKLLELMPAPKQSSAATDANSFSNNLPRVIGMLLDAVPVATLSAALSNPEDLTNMVRQACDAAQVTFPETTMTTGSNNSNNNGLDTSKPRAGVLGVNRATLKAAKADAKKSAAVAATAESGTDSGM